jgi:hypothetical protein
MNQNGDEERIRQLFHELSCQERSLAPKFAGVLARAQNRNKGSETLAWSLKFAAAAGLCLAVLLTIRVLRPVSSQEPAGHDSAPSSIASSGTDTVVVRNASGPIITGRQAGARRRSRQQQFSRSLAITMKSLSSWQSPTAALLQTPQDEMLRTLPRLGESLQTIKSFSPDQFN